MATPARKLGDIVKKSSDNIDDKELKGFYLDIAYAAMKVFDDYEKFLIDLYLFHKNSKGAA